MIFRILGSASGYPELGKHHSAYYIETEGQRFLFDCGEGTSQQLIKYDIADNEIDAIIISHYHPDHVAGLFMVLQMFYLRNRTEDLSVFLPENKQFFLKIMDFLYSFPKRFTYKIRWEETENVQAFFPVLTSYPSTHLLSYQEFIKKEELINKMKAFSLLITEKSKKLFISSDIQSLLSIPFHEINADLYVLDGIHPEADEIITFWQANKYHLILSHGLSDILNKEKNNREFELADETKIYYL